MHVQFDPAPVHGLGASPLTASQGKQSESGQIPSEVTSVELYELVELRTYCLARVLHTPFVLEGRD